MNLPNTDTEKFKRNLHGELILPRDARYDEARKIWNAMIDRRPAALVQCAHADDVPHAIAFARDRGLDISIRGAGHNIAGNAIADDGLVIDFSGMKNVSVDPDRQHAEVDPDGTSLRRTRRLSRGRDHSSRHPGRTHQPARIELHDGR